MAKREARPLGGADWLFLAAALALTALLLFARLDDRLLWQDEAETALLAQSVLAYGVPTAFDGRNLISQEGQQEFGPDFVWSWTPWLPHYATAASFAVLGADTWSARFPFVLFGLGTLLVVYALARRISPDPRVPPIAVLMVMTSVPFLLHMRQCRYYAPMAFFATAFLLAYVQILAGRRRAVGWGALAGAGLFHSHYVVFGGVLLGLGVHFLVLSRDWTRLKDLALGLGATALLTLPFVARFGSATLGQSLPGLDQSLRSLGEATDHINRFVLPLLVVALAAGWALAGRRAAKTGSSRERPGKTTWRAASPLVFVAVSDVGLLTLAMPWFFFRYYVALIPIAAILQALVIARVMRAHWLVGFGLLMVLAGTDLAGRALPLEQPTPERSVRHAKTGDEDPGQVVGRFARFVPLAGYLYEISHDATGPIEETLAVLEREALPSDTILVTYGDLPIQFYTDLKVVGGLSREDPAPYLEAEWIFPRAHTHRRGDAALKHAIVTGVDLSRYEELVLPVLDRPYESRPDPSTHPFREPRAGLEEARLLRRRPPAPSGEPG